MEDLLGSSVLETVIGLSFVYSVFSIICTSIQEIIASLLQLRAKDLEYGISQMLGSKEMKDAIYNHPLIKALGEKVQGRALDWGVHASWPATYIPAHTFALALFDHFVPAGGDKPQTLASLRDAVNAEKEGAEPAVKAAKAVVRAADEMVRWPVVWDLLRTAATAVIDALRRFRKVVWNASVLGSLRAWWRDRKRMPVSETLPARSPDQRQVDDDFIRSKDLSAKPAINEAYKAIQEAKKVGVFQTEAFKKRDELLKAYWDAADKVSRLEGKRKNAEQDLRASLLAKLRRGKAEDGDLTTARTVLTTAKEKLGKEQLSAEIEIADEALDKSRQAVRMALENNWREAARLVGEAQRALPKPGLGVTKEGDAVTKARDAILRAAEMVRLGQREDDNTTIETKISSADPAIKAAYDAIKAADGIILVTPKAEASQQADQQASAPSPQQGSAAQPKAVEAARDAVDKSRQAVRMALDGRWGEAERLVREAEAALQTASAGESAQAILALIDSAGGSASLGRVTELADMVNRELVAPSDEKTKVLNSINDAVSLAQVRDVISGLPDSSAKAKALVWLDNAQRGLEAARGNVETWFDDNMKSVTGLYTRQARNITVAIALVVVLVSGADTIRMCNAFQNNSALRTYVVEQASLVVQAQPTATPAPALAPTQESKAPASETVTPAPTATPTASGLDSARLEDLDKTLDKLQGVLGWDDWPGKTIDDKKQLEWPGWQWLFKKFAGLMLTVAAVSLGAPFWFDVLNRIAKLRGTGPKPDEPSEAASKT